MQWLQTVGTETKPSEACEIPNIIWGSTQFVSIELPVLIWVIINELFDFKNNLMKKEEQNELEGLYK